jgi:hypothetical protein
MTTLLHHAQGQDRRHLYGTCQEITSTELELRNL